MYQVDSTGGRRLDEPPTMSVSQAMQMAYSALENHSCTDLYEPDADKCETCRALKVLRSAYPITLGD